MNEKDEAVVPVPMLLLILVGDTKENMDHLVVMYTPPPNV